MKRSTIDTSRADDDDMLGPLLKRTSGVTSTNRKKSSVENAVTKLRSVSFVVVHISSHHVPKSML